MALQKHLGELCDYWGTAHVIGTLRYTAKSYRSHRTRPHFAPYHMLRCRMRCPKLAASFTKSGR